MIISLQKIDGGRNEALMLFEIYRNASFKRQGFQGTESPEQCGRRPHPEALFARGRLPAKRQQQELVRMLAFIVSRKPISRR